MHKAWKEQVHKHIGCNQAWNASGHHHSELSAELQRHGQQAVAALELLWGAHKPQQVVRPERRTLLLKQIVLQLPHSGLSHPSDGQYSTRSYPVSPGQVSASALFLWTGIKRDIVQYVLEVVPR